MSFFLVLAGFGMLAAGTWRQSAMIFGKPPRARIRFALLGIGYTLLSLSLASVLLRNDPARALVEWFGQLTAAAAMVLLGCWQMTRNRDRRRQ